MIDTSILIDILRKKERILALINNLPEESLFTTEISVMELYYGIYSNSLYQNNQDLERRRLEEIDKLTHHFMILPFHRNAAIKTAEIMGKLKKQGQSLDFRDGMIAGISISNGITRILTHSTRHFQQIPDLTIITD